MIYTKYIVFKRSYNIMIIIIYELIIIKVQCLCFNFKSELSHCVTRGELTFFTKLWLPAHHVG